MADNSNIMYNALNTDFKLRVSTGALQGYSVIDKFGFNPLIEQTTDPEDIWEQGGVYEYTASTGALYYISSTDATDTQECLFFVLTVDSNGNWNEETIVQNLAGQTKTQLITNSGDPIVRIWRAENNDNTDLAGTVYVYEDDTVVAGVPQSGNATIRAIVNAENNQTLMALYTIPTGKVGFLFKGEIGIRKEGGVGATVDYVTGLYQSRRFNKVFQIKKILTNIIGGDSNYSDKRSFPDPIPAKTDVKLTAKEVSASVGAWGAFDIILIDENLLSDDYLSSINQIKRV